MPTVRGRADVKRLMAQTPAELVEKVLVGAGRAAGKIVMTEAQQRVRSPEVRDGLEMKTRIDGPRIIVTISIKPGWARSIGSWLEYGTAPHYISVDDSQRQGMSVNRVNKGVKAGTLVIGGEPVGKTVHHPGARPSPFLRVSLDLKEVDAIAAAQGYINARVRPGGIIDVAPPETDA